MKLLIISLSVFFTLHSQASDIKIGLFHANKTESVVVSIIEGSYQITGNESIIGQFKSNSIFQVELSGSCLYLSDAGNSFGPFDRISFMPLSDKGVFSVRPVFPPAHSKETENRLDITVDNTFLKIINTISLENYLPGVVEAEGGSNAQLEYYKAQAILARTFAVRNYLRHAHEGYNICDDVHCQAFNGKSYFNKKIHEAVKSTDHLILTDLNNQSVMTAYHSSCGGMTASASLEWNRDLDYLVPVKDPFCNNSKNKNWTKSISKKDWSDYLARKGYEENKVIYSKNDVRKKFLDTEGSQIALNSIRWDFRLKSSWFYIEDHGSEVVFHGHGYGHGLGMCQEGAMEMARVGYTYLDILMFYFRSLKVTSLPAPSSGGNGHPEISGLKD